MNITDLTFLFGFLPIIVIAYYIVPNPVREYLLVAASLVFYAMGDMKHLALFLISVIFNILIARTMNRCTGATRRTLLIIAVAADIAALSFYKYNGFLPLGISFFTFKEISYLADVYTKKIDLSDNIMHDAFYISFFAQIQAGPISRYAESNVQISRDRFASGVIRFITGICKKILLANTLLVITRETFGTPPR